MTPDQYRQSITQLACQANAAIHRLTPDTPDEQIAAIVVELNRITADVMTAVHRVRQARQACPQTPAPETRN